MASGDTLLVLSPLAAELPSAAYASLGVRNNHPVLEFDQATDETARFTAVLPRQYGGGGVTVALHLTDAADTNAAHASYWDVAFERLTAQDLDADSFAAAQSNHAHPNGTSGIPVVIDIPFADGAQMDSVGAGELFRLSVTRDANHASDDWGGDAQLLAVEIRET